MLFARDIEYRVENLHSGLSLCIGGDVEKGLVTYIHHYGFYEGGGMIAPFFFFTCMFHSLHFTQVPPMSIELTLHFFWHS